MLPKYNQRTDYIQCYTLDKDVNFDIELAWKSSENNLVLIRLLLIPNSLHSLKIGCSGDDKHYNLHAFFGVSNEFYIVSI